MSNRKIKIDIIESAKETIKKKNADYTASSSDIFKNFTSSAVFGVPPVKGVQMRMMDKFQRLRTMALKGKLQVPESALDSCEDLVNYAVLMCGIMHQEQDTEPMSLDVLLAMHNDICVESERFSSDIEKIQKACIVVTPTEYMLQECVIEMVSLNNTSLSGEQLLVKAFNVSAFIVSRVIAIASLLK